MPSPNRILTSHVGSLIRPDELVVLLTRVTSSTARIVNDLIADDLAQRLVQWREVRGA